MAIKPRQNLTINDPGLGNVGNTDRGFLGMGTASTGTVDVLKSFGKKQAVVDYFGQGPLSEGLCRTLDIAGGPVFGIRLNGSVAGAAGSVTKTSGGGSGTGTVTVAGAAFDSYRVKIQITKAGVLGGAEFKYSLDFTSNADAGSSAQNEGRTFSPVIVVPSGGGGAYVIPDTNLTITFVPGSGSPTTYDLGDVHRFDCTAPLYSTSDLGTAFTALLLTTQALATIALYGEHATASASATMFSSFSTQLTSMETAFRFVRGIMDGGSLENNRATAITAHAASQSSRIALPYGYCDIASSKPIVGWGTPQRTYVGLLGARVTSDKISTDSARVASGAITGVLALRNDEELSPLLNAADFVTMTSLQGLTGFYITQNPLRSAAGSDFVYWQHGAVMDVASDTVVKAQTNFIKRQIKTNPDGTIKEKNARQMEGEVTGPLRAALIDPKNEEGDRGHVSDFGYSIDRENNLLTSETLNTTTKIRPDAYASVIETEIGFSTAVG